MAFDRNEWRPNKKQAQFLALPNTIKEGFYGGGAGSGKLLSLDTPIMTPGGLVPIGDISIGDYVIGLDGLPKLVFMDTPNHFDERLYEITFANGQKIKAGANHLWRTWTDKDRSTKTDEARAKRRYFRNRDIDKYHHEKRRTTTDHGNLNRVREDVALRNALNRAESYHGTIRNTEELFQTQRTSRDRLNHSIEVSAPVQFIEQELPIHPYILGAWLGDGAAQSDYICIGNQDYLGMLFNINECGYEIRPIGNDGKTFKIIGLSFLLRCEELKNNKHIPEIYFTSSFEQRLQLLQGLLDTDGHCYDIGDVEFCNTNLNLINGVFRIAASLGLKPSIKKAWHDGNPNHAQAWYVVWNHPLNVFKLERKKQNLPQEISARSKYHYIESIKEIPNELGKCIQVEDGFYLVSESCIPTHNSDVLLIYPLAKQWHRNPRFKQVFMRRTFPELRNEIVPRSREIYTRFGATFNKSDMAWTFPREDQFGGTGLSNAGAIIYLGHCENDDDVHKYDSMEINLFTPDELTSFSEYIYLYIGLTRVRTSDPTLPAVVRAAGMPGGIGHTFVKRRFIDPYKAGGRIIVGKGGNKRIYIHSTLADNPHIDPNYGQSLEGLTEAEKKAKKFGDWDAYLGLVFDEFREKPYPDEPANACHVIAPMTIPSWWPKFVIGDWGYAAMTYIMYCAVSPEKRLYIYREQSFIKTKIAEWAPDVKEYIDKEHPKIVKFCKSVGQDRGQEQTIQQQLTDALGCPVELSNNSPGTRVAGKILIHEYLRWTSKRQLVNELPEYNEEHAQWLLRMKGMAEYRAYLNLYKAPEDEKNLPKLQIFRCDKEFHDTCEACCPLVIEAIKAAGYAKPKNDKPVEDVAEWSGDDPYDTLRYAVDTAERYFSEAIEEFKKVVAQSNLEARLQNTQDYTGFYRNMHKLESEEISIRPVALFHKRGGRRVSWGR